MSSGDGVTGESFEGEGVEFEAGLGDEGLFDAGFGSHELHGSAGGAQAIRHAERGDCVSARTPAGYQDARRVFLV